MVFWVACYGWLWWDCPTVNIPRAVLIGLFVMGFALRAAAQDDLKGKTEAELLAAKGPPTSKSVLGNKAIYRWDDAEVNLVNGKVTTVYARDANDEQQSRAWSEKRKAEEAIRLQKTAAQQAKDVAANREHMQQVEQQAMRAQTDRANENASLKYSSFVRTPEHYADTASFSATKPSSPQPTVTHSITTAQLPPPPPSQKQIQAAIVQQHNAKQLELDLISARRENLRNSIQTLNNVAATAYRNGDDKTKLEATRLAEAQKHEMDLLKQKQTQVMLDR